MRGCFGGPIDEAYQRWISPNMYQVAKYGQIGLSDFIYCPNQRDTFKAAKGIDEMSSCKTIHQFNLFNGKWFHVNLTNGLRNCCEIMEGTFKWNTQKSPCGHKKSRVYKTLLLRNLLSLVVNHTDLNISLGGMVQKYKKNFLHGTWLALLLDPMIKKVQITLRLSDLNCSRKLFE